MKRHFLRLLVVGGLALAAACDGGPQSQDTAKKPDRTTPQDHPPVSKEDPMKLTMPRDVTPATMIAYSGHGMYFDHLARQIKVDDLLVQTMERSMSDQLMERAAGKLDDKEVALIKEAQAYAQSGELKPAYAALLQGAVTSRLMEFADERLLAQFEWRHRLLMRRYTRLTIDRRWLELYPVELRGLLRFAGPWVFIQPSTDYVQRCRADDVPIPPQWSEANPNGWEYHGKLVQNLLQPGDDAHVWTWSDPHDRGACVFLPRGTSGNGLAGTLCQSAATGKACIWDNLDRTTGAVLGWKNVTLNVNQMQDGDMLASNCTGCHRGNNAFLMSPDDPTWAKILRPVNQATVGATFTTNLDAGIPRYTMISNQAGWTNPSASQCIGCHERPTVGFANVPNPMPPNCANSNNDPSACYN